jgi:hypothetical protein
MGDRVSGQHVLITTHDDRRHRELVDEFCDCGRHMLGVWLAVWTGTRVSELMQVGGRFGVHAQRPGNRYAYTEVLDRAVHSYHRNGAAIEVIWSRRRADDTEIDRLAVHFEVIRTPNGWRIAGIQRRPTQSDLLVDAWTAPDRTPPAH